MATIIREFRIDVSADRAWAALRDCGAVHEKLARGFVTACDLDGETRSLTFANGMSVREQLVGIDANGRRLSYTARGGRASHHNASAQVFADGEQRTRFVWIADVLPHEVAAPIAAMMDQGVVAIRATLEQG